MILYIFTWPSSTSRDLAKWRFRLALFFVKIWRRPGRVRFNLPVAVTLNRALTALRVFILGMAFLLLRLFSGRSSAFWPLAARREYSGNGPPHHLRGRFHN